MRTELRLKDFFPLGTQPFGIYGTKRDHIKPHIRELRCEDLGKSEMTQYHTDFIIRAAETQFTNRSTFTDYSITDAAKP
jgi:hypothetical protein